MRGVEHEVEAVVLIQSHSKPSCFCGTAVAGERGGAKQRILEWCTRSAQCTWGHYGGRNVPFGWLSFYFGKNAIL